MKGTSILSIKSWLSKIHPPLPRSARESQQLLTVLTASFQQQLDEAHPPIESRHRSLNQNPPTTSTNSRVILSNTNIRSDGSTVAIGRPSMAPLRELLNREIKGRGDHAVNLDNLLRLLDQHTGLGEASAADNDKADLTEVVKGWFNRSNMELRVLVLRNASILYALRARIPRHDFVELLWSQIERLVHDMPFTVTFEEAEAISLASDITIKSTPRNLMPRSADSFTGLVAHFKNRGYSVSAPDMSTSSMNLSTFHPLADPALRLSQFIFLHPSSHGLTQQHFDALLSVSALWVDQSSLSLQLLQGLYPSKSPSLFGILSVLKNGDLRVSSARRLRSMGASKSPVKYERVLSHLAQLAHQHGHSRDADLITAFLRAFENKEDCYDISRYIEEIHQERIAERSYIPAFT